MLGQKGFDGKTLMDRFGQMGLERKAWTVRFDEWTWKEGLGKKGLDEKGQDSKA